MGFPAACDAAGDGVDSPRTGVTPFLPDRFPVFLLEDAARWGARIRLSSNRRAGGRVKVAIHGSADVCTPETVDREIHERDLRRIVEQLRMRIPALDGKVLRAQTCMYTMSPDEHFVIGAHPQFASCSIACGFSGHGFKFACVVGEILGGPCDERIYFASDRVVFTDAVCGVETLHGDRE